MSTINIGFYEDLKIIIFQLQYAQQDGSIFQLFCMDFSYFPRTKNGKLA